MADEYSPIPADDGVLEAPLRLARAWLTRLIDDALIEGKTSALTDRKRRRVYLVPPKAYEQDRRNEAIVAALQQTEPALYERLLAEAP